MSEVKRVKRPLSPEEKKQRAKLKKVNNNLIMLIVLATIITTVVFSINIVRIGFKKGATTGGDTLQVESNKPAKNDQYTIGNNPTALQKDYFKELTNALGDTSEEGKIKIAEAVTKCFISDYFTWTNKDGNYEVGGLQYIFGPKYIMFQEESRWTFYADLDLYISQYGRENLLEVSNVTINSATAVEDQKVNGQMYKGYYVDASWEYKPSSNIDVSEFQNRAYFVLVENEGRLEIIQMQPVSW